MDLDSLDWLQSPPGQDLLAELAARPLAEGDTLRELTRLRRRYSAEQARAAVELSLLRRRARAKFPDADRLYLTREALEQASSAPVAAHRARRLAGRAVADCCCGVGADALAMAEAGCAVTAIDRDPLRLAMAEANAQGRGLAGRVAFMQRDLLEAPPPPAEVIFCDPGRRAAGRRRFAVEAYEPPLSHILGWRAQTPALGVKLAPGVDITSLPDAGEIEFVALDGELKEAVLWCGPLAQVRRRATVLRHDIHGAVRVDELTSDRSAEPASSILPPASFLYEPDPAVIRAGLVRDLAQRIGAAQLDPEIAYLTAEQRVATPFARAWPILSWMPFGLKALKARLRGLDAGAVTVKKRGSPLDTDALARELSGPGRQPLVVVLTQASGRPIALICAAAG